LGENEKIYALIGGFHLTQASADRINKTIKAFKEKEIDYLIPLHCTGFEAMASIWQAFPRKFIVPSVGTRFEF
jgi:7,8-dihydropterin-6-yl-methyl-4-(beta-D-ribofuranosyl)aminobenzene 5'-phosphate synthase